MLSKFLWQSIIKSLIMTKENSLLEEIVALAKKEGVLSFNLPKFMAVSMAFFDYGPLGVELRKNIKDAWWEDMVRRRDDMVGLDSGIIMNPRVWEASGHVDGFTDPMVDCKESKNEISGQISCLLRKSRLMGTVSDGFPLSNRKICKQKPSQWQI